MRSVPPGSVLPDSAMPAAVMRSVPPGSVLPDSAMPAAAMRSAPPGSVLPDSAMPAAAMRSAPPAQLPVPPPAPGLLPSLPAPPGPAPPQWPPDPRPPAHSPVPGSPPQRLPLHSVPLRSLHSDRPPQASVHSVRVYFPHQTACDHHRYGNRPSPHPPATCRHKPGPVCRPLQDHTISLQMTAAD